MVSDLCSSCEGPLMLLGIVLPNQMTLVQVCLLHASLLFASRLQFPFKVIDVVFWYSLLRFPSYLSLDISFQLREESSKSFNGPHKVIWSFSFIVSYHSHVFQTS